MKFMFSLMNEEITTYSIRKLSQYSRSKLHVIIAIFEKQASHYTCKGGLVRSFYALEIK